MNKQVLVIDKRNVSNEKLKEILLENPNIKFLSLMGVDLGGNATDEKVPISLLLEDVDHFLKSAIQTDGSSVELHNIATLNNAKVDLMPDQNCKWYVDYNSDNIDEETGRPVGTLIIPALLIHDNKKVGSRGILRKAQSHFEKSLIEIFREYPHILKDIGIDSVDDIEKIVLTAATELEFWVNTPEDKADLEELAISQSLKEQYWKRTHGIIRTCLEQTLDKLEKMDMHPEMAHKEVGGIASSINRSGKTKHAMEQLEISWRFDNPLQAADNELIVRQVVEDIFTMNGLEVTFKAKPIQGVAGSGGHTHVGVSLILKDGKSKNLFAPKDMANDYLSVAGYGALMGLLYNYEVINPIVANNIDSFERLVPGFEAPVCIVTSLGHSCETPSRNRSVLVGLIRDAKNPKSLRFELRSPSPLSNTYLVISACYQAMLHGIKFAAKSGFDTKALEKELSKDIGEEGVYLEKDRKYRDENNVFEHYTEEERNERFGIPPKTVYENMLNLSKYEEKIECLKDGNVFTDSIINSFKYGSLDKWKKELRHRIIHEDMDTLRGYVRLHNKENMDALDEVNWNKISDIKFKIMKDTLTTKSLFTRINDAIDNKDYEAVSELQLELSHYMIEIRNLYRDYKKNIY